MILEFMMKKCCVKLGTIVICLNLCSAVVGSCVFKNETKKILDELVSKYSESDVLTYEQFKNLADHVVATGDSLHVVLNSQSSFAHVSYNFTSKSECPTVKDIFLLYSDGSGVLTTSNLSQALTSLVYLVVNGNCNHREEELKHGVKPPSAQVWGYGVGFVTLICVISNVGGLLAPFIKKAFFRKLLTFLVSMAVGTLAATGLMVLIPEAFEMMSCDRSGGYLWKAATSMAGIYIFYISERVLKLVFYKPKIYESTSSDSKVPLTENGHTHIPEHMTEDLKSGTTTVSTVAWMVLIGDALHNFVDGLSIGAAFTQNIYTGVSVSMAVVCEELPHELGDIAILLHSGLSMKKALFYNFLAAVFCYGGLIIGILLGENTSANRWIFAVAGGLFLYVALVDMLPELSHTADEFQRQKVNPWNILFLQTIGLLFGFGIILIVANYSHH